MKKTVSFVSEILVDLALGLWVGGAGMIVLSVVSIFGYFGKDRSGLAGAVAGPIFQRFFLVLLIAWCVMAAAMLVRKCAQGGCCSLGRTRELVVLFLMLLMLGGAVAEHCFILPRLEKIRAEANLKKEEPLPKEGELHDRFYVLHGISVALMVLNMAFGVGVVALRAAGPRKTD